MSLSQPSFLSMSSLLDALEERKQEVKQQAIFWLNDRYERDPLFQSYVNTFVADGQDHIDDEEVKNLFVYLSNNHTVYGHGETLRLIEAGSYDSVFDALNRARYGVFA